MSSPNDAYRNELAAAHARIEELERAANLSRNMDGKAATLAALYRERARAAEPPVRENWKRLLVLRVLVPLGILATVFVINGDWIRSTAVIVVGVAAWFGTAAVVRSSVRANARQLEIVNREIALIETELRTKTIDASAVRSETGAE